MMVIAIKIVAGRCKLEKDENGNYDKNNIFSTSNEIEKETKEKLKNKKEYSLSSTNTGMDRVVIGHN